MNELRIERLPELRAPVLITAFSGWNDAAEVATGVVNHLVTTWSAETVASIDPEEFYVFTETRPHVRVIDGAYQRQIDWPANTFYAYVDPHGDHDYLLLVGVEPNLRWRAFTSAILGLAQQCGVSSLVTIGGLLAEVTHRRPVRVSGSGTTPELRERMREMGAEGSRYEGPTGIVGVLQDVFRQAEIPSASLWGQVPHYLSATPNPPVLLALLSRLNSLLDLRLDLNGQELDARRFVGQVDSALTRDPDAAAYVRRLEDQAEQGEDDDETETTPADSDDPGADTLPSGEAVVRELEDFLRRRRNQGNSPADSAADQDG